MTGREKAVVAVALALLLATFGAALAGCATLTQPPKSWPPVPSCAQDPNQPQCAPPIHDERSR